MKLLALLPLLLVGNGDAGSLFFYMPLISKSMKITFMPIANEMAKRGHEVVVLMPFASKEPNPKVKEIIIKSSFLDMTERVSKEKLQDGSDSSPPFSELMEQAYQSNDGALGHPEVRALLDAKKKFDIVVVMPFMICECGYFLADKFEATTVGYFTGQCSLPFVDKAIGQPHNPAYLPLPFFEYSTDMTFVQRVINFVATHALQVVREWYFIGKANELLMKHFPGEKLPDLIEKEKNISLIMGFGHPFLMDGWRPKAPNYVDVGMMNCRKPDPKFEDPEIADFLDNANSDDGVIYVSFGSVLQSSQMSESKRKMFINTFARFPRRRFLWKWETEKMADKPANVMLKKWLPQQDVLGHRNVKAFISHGGQSSYQETLCHQKPAVFVSVLGDQLANGKDASRKGFGVSAPFQTLTEESLWEAINEVLTDPTYAEKAREIGSLVADQLEHPLERAVWWLEHLMRHPKMYENRSPVHKLTWYQYFSLDVIFTLCMIVVLAGFIIYKVCCCCFGFFSSKTKKKAKARKRD